MLNLLQYLSFIAHKEAIIKTEFPAQNTQDQSFAPDHMEECQHQDQNASKCLDQNGAMRSCPKLCEICGKSFEGKNR